MIYEYRCNDCQKTQEFWMKISDPHPAACQHCGSSKLERIISATSFALKGSGWYTSDYKRKSNGGSSGGSEGSGQNASGNDSSACTGMGPGNCGGPCASPTTGNDARSKVSNSASN